MRTGALERGENLPSDSEEGHPRISNSDNHLDVTRERENIIPSDTAQPNPSEVNSLSYTEKRGAKERFRKINIFSSSQSKSSMDTEQRYASRPKRTSLLSPMKNRTNVPTAVSLSEDDDRLSENCNVSSSSEAEYDENYSTPRLKNSSHKKTKTHSATHVKRSFHGEAYTSGANTSHVIGRRRKKTNCVTPCKKDIQREVRRLKKKYFDELNS